MFHKEFSNCQFTDFTVNSEMTCSFSENVNLPVFYLKLLFRFIRFFHCTVREHVVLLINYAHFTVAFLQTFTIKIMIIFSVYI